MDKLWPFEGTDSYKGHYQCPPALFIDQDEARRAEKKNFEAAHPPPPPFQVMSQVSLSALSVGVSHGKKKRKGKERDFCRSLSTERELRLILKRDKKMIGRTLDKRRWKFTSLGALALGQKPPCFNVRAHKGIYIANAFQIWWTLDGYKVLAERFEPIGCGSFPRDFTASCFLFRLIFWLIMVGGHKLV